MIAKHEPFAVSADWVLPIDSPPIQNGWVVIRSGLVEFVGGQLPAIFKPAIRFHLNGFAILPGLINAHCHLEFSDLKQPLPSGNSFADWIGSLLAYRRSLGNSSAASSNSKREAITSGIRESYAAGVRWIADMTTQPWERGWIAHAVESALSDLSPLFFPAAPIVMEPCVEILDIVKSKFNESHHFAAEQLSAPMSECIADIGYAPHAPYTTSLSATQKCVELSSTHRRLVTMHLAESADEIEWLKHHSGGFANLLGPILGDDYFEGLGQISEYLDVLTTAPRALIAHGNYLAEKDLHVLASRSQRMAIAHCPRTHRHFGHLHDSLQKYPLAGRISLGVRHLLGTDSRASNPDLNIWSEAKQVHENHPDVSSKKILNMITHDAANFLGIEERYGTVRSGIPALLTAIKLESEFQSSRKSFTSDQVYDVVLGPKTTSAPLELVLSNDALVTKETLSGGMR